MAQTVLPICGDLVEPSDLALPKAQELARFLQSATNPFARLLECRARAGEEIVVLELEVELPQRPTHDIRHTEQLATIFFQGDGTYSLRSCHFAPTSHWFHTSTFAPQSSPGAFVSMTFRTTR